MTQSTTLQPHQCLSADDIRQALILRIKAFCLLADMTRNELGIAALNDHHVIRDIEAGRNISLRTYERLTSYMDERWPQEVNQV